MSRRSSRRPDRISLSSRPARASGLAEVEVDGETVVYDELTGSIHQLDPTATVVWNALDGVVTVRELTADLAAVYGVPVAQIRRDVMALLNTLLAAGLLQQGRDAVVRAMDEVPADAH